MASYQELLEASSDPTLTAKLRVAVVIAAETVRTELPATANHVNRLTWAANVFANPDGEARRMMWAVLAQNKAASLAAILGASDATVQAAVDAAVDVFAV
jgi:hypothetical protein